MIPVTDDSPDIERARIEEMTRIEDRILNEERVRVDNAAQAGDAAQAESVLTEEERARINERALAIAQELMLFVARYRRDVAGRTDEELIAEAPRDSKIRHPLELTRRLIDSNKNLQSELATSRESSERLTTGLSSQITGLTGELVKFRTSSDTLAGRVLWWTRVLAVLTAVLLVATSMLIWLTVVLVQRTPAAFLIDCRSRPGQSGSPAIFAASEFAPYRHANGSIATGPVQELIGVYSGRLHNDSDIGVVWKRDAVREIVEHGVQPELGTGPEHRV